MRTPVTKTTKGHRVWLQGLSAHGWQGGTRFNTTITPAGIVHTRDPEGKRKVTAAKGGIIDTVSQKVTRWAQGSTEASVQITHDIITIQRES